MKKFIYIPTLVISFFSVLYSNELSWVDEQIKAIKPSRVGISNKTLGSLRNPFIYLKREKEDEKEKKTSPVVIKKHYTTTKHYVKKYTSLTLEATMNKSALISGKWFKEGQSVRGYKLIKVNPTNVVLIKHKKRIILSTKSKKTNLKFSK